MAVEAWLWDHFQTQEAADKWQAALDDPPPFPFRHPTLTDFDIVACGWRALIVVCGRLLNEEPSSNEAPAPPGWSDDELFAEAVRTMGASPQIIQ